MKKFLYMAFIAISALVFSSCGSDSFTIEGELSDAGTQNLRFVYLAEGKVNSHWIPSVGGQFTMQGNSKELTVVYIYSSRMKFLTHAVIKNGETITLKGSIADNYNIEADGSDVNNEWNSFIRNNAEAFAKADRTQANSAIASFVKANPGNLVSTLLLTCDYTGTDLATLAAGIDEKAKPEQLISLYENELQSSTEKETKVTPFALRDDRDSLTIVSLKKPYNILYFWYDDKDKQRSEYIEKIKSFAKERKTEITVSDIYLNCDTTGWRTTLKNDSTNWKHYRAFAGTVDKSIERLNVKGSNFIIVADSTGKQLYRGQSAEEAISVIKNPKR